MEEARLRPRPSYVAGGASVPMTREPGGIEGKAEAVDEAAIQAAVARGIERFNAGEYHAALDEWELPYHEAGATRGPLYLGLVRASAALHHFARGQWRSARKLGASARALLATPPPADDGLDLDMLLAELERVLAPLEAAASDAEAARLRPAFRPQLRRRARTS
jgi:predicted metal-dependent hydrolase